MEYFVNKRNIYSIRKVYFCLLFLTAFLNAKPQLLIFTGPEECLWSQVWISEALSQNDFIETVSQEVELVQIPFSDRESRDTYGVDVFPTTILLFEGERSWQEIPCLPFNSTEYIATLREIIVFKQFLSRVSLPAFDLIDLKELYIKAKELHLHQEAQYILEEGVKKEKNTYFLLEKYASLVQCKTKKDPEVSKLRELIKKRDPEDRQAALFHLALFDFKRGELKKNKSPRKIIEPLIEYVKQFKSRHKANVWRAEMVIASYFFNHNKKQAAMRHALHGLEVAPEDMKAHIRRVIESFSTAG